MSHLTCTRCGKKQQYLHNECYNCGNYLPFLNGLPLRKTTMLVYMGFIIGIIGVLTTNMFMGIVLIIVALTMITLSIVLMPRNKQEIRQCPRCRNTVYKHTDFCTVCGYDGSSKLSNENNDEICPNCNKVNPKGNSFCTSCGKNICLEL